MRLFNRFAAAPSLPRQRGTTGPAPHLQICAHTDDDLYFMTPDLLQSVEAGVPIVSVYLTTGEADGINLAMDDPARKTAVPDFAGYTAARQHGIRAAYAAMVTGSRRAPWQRSTLKVRDGVTAEISTLGENRVVLIFLNLRTGHGAAGSSIIGLWRETSADLATLRPTDSPIPAKSDGRRMTRSAVIDTLADLLKHYAPSVVRIMNPDPDRTAIDQKTGEITYADNPDHTATAFFAMAALDVYERTEPEQPPAVESYLGYCNKLRPNNLSAQQAARKFSYLSVYGGEDGHDCERPPGLCGDRPLGNRAYNRFYGQSTSYRWQPSTSWLQQRADGRLTAFGVRGGRPVMWTQDRPGGESWSGPEPLGQWPAAEGRCLSRLDAVRDASGRIHVIAVRARVGAAPERQQRDLMHVVQDAHTGAFGAWTDLQSPYSTAAQHEPRRRALGMPIVAVTGNHVRVVIRNFGGGLSTRLLTEDGWQPWDDLQGGALEGAAAVTLRRGTVEFYATSRMIGMGMLRWHQRTPGGAFERDYGTQLARPAAPVTLVEQSDGSLLMFSRQPGTGWVLANRQDGQGGIWDTQPEIADTTPGFGPLAHAVLPTGEAALVQRSDDHGLTLSIQPLDGSPLTHEWTPLGGSPFLHAPSAALDAAGNLVVAHLDAQARLNTLTLPAATGYRPSQTPTWSPHPTTDREPDRTTAPVRA
ncbi:PIG-L family deacetylase [Streptomyces sp. NPDC023838]|uniref:PIG-L family deacetylase n=1 Tax=Streptomyces sp. NPDC023838 TaxID=3154325 RepID=UPI0033DE57B8